MVFIKYLLFLLNKLDFLLSFDKKSNYQKFLKLSQIYDKKIKSKFSQQHYLSYLGFKHKHS